MVLSTKDIVEIVAVAILPIGLICITTDRIVSGRGIGARIIQFATIIFLMPILLILSLEKFLDATTVGTLFGAVCGYLLSGISNYDSREAKKSDDKKGNTDAPRS